MPGVSAGPIDNWTSYEEMLDVFGAENLEETTIKSPDGEEQRATILFGGSKNECLIEWEVYHSKPAAVVVKHPEGRWKTGRNIHVGASLDSLVNMNGDPISFRGFGGKDSGLVMDWRGGLLEKDHKLAMSIVLMLRPQEPFYESDLKKMLGDEIFQSDFPVARKLNIQVDYMKILLSRRLAAE